MNRWLKRMVRFPHTFLMLNAAALVGFIYYFSGKKVVWDPVGTASSKEAIQ